jgi:hypothetical protein
MNLKSIVKKVESKEVLTCILLIMIGYMTAQLFMRRVSGFNVGGQTECPFKDAKCKIDGKHLYSKSAPDICNTLTKESCNDSWYENTTLGGGNNNVPIGSSCKWVNNNKCVTPGTGFKTITDACPTKSCSGSGSGSGSGVKPTPPPPTYSCSSTGFFTSDKCLKDGSVVTDPSSDDGCKAADCNSWYGPYKFWLYFGIVMLLIFLFIGGYALTR